MDSRQPWNDFHFLNTAFRAVTQLGSQTWIQASLVRFTYRGNKDRSVSRTVRAIDGLAIEYAVPFPLTYLFGPESSASYSSLFCFLLQIRRAKNVLDRILIRGLNNGVLDYGMPDLKVFHLLRCRLSWFVKCVVPV
jgi:gamma-tubulin complex component 5